MPPLKKRARPKAIRVPLVYRREEYFAKKHSPPTTSIQQGRAHAPFMPEILNTSITITKKVIAHIND
jgi:hypothetical protein